MKKNLFILALLLIFVQCTWAQCSAPTNLTVMAVTGSTADFRWQRADAANNQWEVICLLESDTIIPDTTYAASYDTIYSVSGLQANTAYVFYVRTFCSADSQSTWTAIPFRTACVSFTLMDIPYIDSLDAYPGTSAEPATEVLPYCWSHFYAGTNPARAFYPYLHNTYGDNQLCFHIQYTDETRGDEVAILPVIDTTEININQLTLSFQAKKQDASPFANQTDFRFVVGVMAGTDYTTFVPVDSFVTTGYSMTDYEVVFHNYQGGGNCIAIVATANQPNSGLVFNHGFIDNIALDFTACARPSEVHASNISTTSLNVNWTSTGDESEWDIQYKASTDTVWTVLSNITTNPYLLENLTAATNYEIAVRANCGGNTSEWRYATALVPTLACDAANQCQFAFTLSNNYTSWQGASISAYDNGTLIGNLTLNQSGSQTYQLGLCSGNTLSLVWHSGAWDSDCSFSLTDPNGYVIYSFGVGQAPSNGSTFFTTVANCAMATCPRPTNLAVSNVQSNSVDLSWTAGGSETEWILEYRLISSSSWTEESVVANPYNLQGLMASSMYEMRIRALCSATDTSDYSESVLFNTTCGVTLLPYEEDFNAYTTDISYNEYETPAAYPNVTLPTCWSFLNRSTTSADNPRVFLSAVASYAVSGKSLFFTSSNTTPVFAILPQFEDSLNTVQLSFSYRNEGTSASNGILTVGYMTNPNDASTFTAVQSLTRVNTMTEVTVSFADIVNPGAGARIAFRYDGTSNLYFMSIDDVLVESLNSCHKPSDFVAAAVAVDQVLLSWNETGSATAWDVEYETQGVASQVVTVTENPVVVGNLIPGQIYSFKVRAVCGDGFTSAWNGPVYACPNSYNMPVSGTDSIHLCSGVIYDNGGFDGKYASNCNATVVVYPETVGAKIKVSGSFEIEAGYDYLVIYDGNAIDDTAATVLFRSSISSEGALVGPIPECVSTTGPVTLVFHSDATAQWNGFEIQVACVGLGPDPCDEPENLSVVNVTDNAALAIWDEMEGVVTWYVKYRAASDTSWNELSVNVNAYQMYGLTANTHYFVAVQTVCEDGIPSQFVETEFTTQAVGVEDYDIEVRGISLMPNPANNYVELRIDAAQSVREAVLFNAQGQAIQYIRLTDNHARLDISNLASGMYFIAVFSNNAMATKQFIKQ